jgi:hypothetical protein
MWAWWISVPPSCSYFRAHMRLVVRTSESNYKCRVYSKMLLTLAYHGEIDSIMLCLPLSSRRTKKKYDEKKASYF